MKKYRSAVIIAGLIILLLILLHNVIPIKTVISKETNYKYETGIKLTEDNQIIENYIFRDIPIGIVVYSSNNVIANCEFTDCSDEGILLVGDNNVVRDCSFTYCTDGIELQKSSNNVIIRCSFVNNYHAGVDGIKDNNNNNLFSYCTFYNNPFGIYFKNSENNRYINCDFANNKIDLLEAKYE